VLRFESEVREGKQVTALVQLREQLGVASATASKALQWMHEVGVIGYFAGKNGVGIRIFINRATSSVGTRTSQSKKFWPSLLLHPVRAMLQQMKHPLMTASLIQKLQTQM
jgi:DNA-binding transcriptional regulator YhcF (GntR family)